MALVVALDLRADVHDTEAGALLGRVVRLLRFLRHRQQLLLLLALNTVGLAREVPVARRNHGEQAAALLRLVLQVAQFLVHGLHQ